MCSVESLKLSPKANSTHRTTMMGRRRRIAFSWLVCWTLVAASTVSGFTTVPSSWKSKIYVAAHQDPQKKNTNVPATSLDILESPSFKIRPKNGTRHIFELLRWKKWKKPVPSSARKNAEQKNAERKNDLAKYERIKREYEALYASVDSLRDHFGANKNALFGDLSVTEARQLYKKLLPRLVLELYHKGIREEDLAPLAYEARKAAKQYTRERSRIHARFLATAYEVFRQFSRYGQYQPQGMTYNQLIDRYREPTSEDEDEEAMKEVYVKILMKSCQTNDHVDRWALGANYSDEKSRTELSDPDQLEKEIMELLEGHATARFRYLRFVVGVRKSLRLFFVHPQANRRSLVGIRQSLRSYLTPQPHLEVETLDETAPKVSIQEEDEDNDGIDNEDNVPSKNHECRNTNRRKQKRSQSREKPSQKS